MSIIENKPGPDAVSWAEDYRLHHDWRRIALEVWAAVPVEFRGHIENPLTLVQKVEAMVEEIERLRKGAKPSPSGLQ